jgi:hypothetical protein
MLQVLLFALQLPPLDWQRAPLERQSLSLWQ